MQDTSTYLAEVAQFYADEHSSEHSYRTAFQNYLATIFPASDGYFIQQDAQAIAGNKPDYIILRDKVPLLYIEVKKVGEDLDKIEKSQQAERYFGYTNLIISDYVEFRFFRNGQRYDEPIVLADTHKPTRTISPHPDRGEHLARTITDFVATQREPITRAGHLAKIMGGKAQRIRDNVIALLASTSGTKDELEKMQRFIKDHLIAEFTTEDFADMYAQTLVYGLFAARYNDTTLSDFSRQEAQTLVPKTNPFLQSFFHHISGPSFPPRLEVIVDELCMVFAHADVRALMEEYFKQMTLVGGAVETPDPVIHFYENFLREYDPKKKMEMGVFYTPLPVVRFIVRGLDDLLKREFGIDDGLADTATVAQTITHQNDKGKDVTDTRILHRVQVLDVAVGTGTFLNETINFIHERKKSQQGRWAAYVNDALLPRLHGFELMMASYTIAHLKLAMTLGQTGATALTSRLGIYLSNTLDTPHEQTLQGDLFGVVDSIARESVLASEVKHDRPIMVVLGNPPYSGISQNKHYTDNNVYKVEPGGQEKLKEKNSKWINDDYVKFIRFAESMIEKNGEGVVGMITAHSYLDNPTFRGMRWHLRQTFDLLYVLDLHGNTLKSETASDGTADQNIFAIKTGVSILFGVKKKPSANATPKPLATVYRADLYGKREAKFAALDAAPTLENLEWTKLAADCEIWQVEGAGKAEYEKGFSVAELFPVNTVGVVTSRDAFVIDQSKDVLAKRMQDFLLLTPEEAKRKYELHENLKWKVAQAQKHEFNSSCITPVFYRPFDTRYIYYHINFLERPREVVMKHLQHSNVALTFNRTVKNPGFQHIFITSGITDLHLTETANASLYVSPLYLYTETGERVANLDGEIVAAIAGVVGTTPPEDILDYVYAVLHSPRYRATYQEFLKSDFPRVPYPGSESGVSKAVFWELVAHGRHLRELHLLTHSAVRQPITTFPQSGSDIVEKLTYQSGRVSINDTQYWDGVPEAVWQFYIGGYQPAQKYLKDRKGRKLTSAEFENYERLIVSLHETIAIMQAIDTTWPAQS